MNNGISVVASFIPSSNPPPTISSVSPTSVSYGVTASKSIAIRGTNFVQGATITVGNLTGTTVYTGTAAATAANPDVFYTSTQLYFWWPNASLAPGSYTVTVTNPGVAGGLSASLVGGFTITVPQPTISLLNPSSANYGVTASKSIVVSGTNFVQGARISVGTLSGTTVYTGTAVASAGNPYVYYNSGLMYFWWPNNSLPVGTYSVTVTNPASAGGLTATLTGALVIFAPQPAITILNPATVSYGVTASKSVVISGTQFVSGASITVGTLNGSTVYTGVAAASTTNPFVYFNSGRIYFWWSNTSLPRGSYNVTVTNPAAAGGLTVTLTGGFMVN